MAKIWRVYDTGQRGSWGELPWPQCVEALKIDETCRTKDRPTFEDGSKTAVLPHHVVISHRVVIQLEESEARQHGIKPGFFVSPLDGMDAKFKLDEMQERT